MEDIDEFISVASFCQTQILVVLFCQNEMSECRRCPSANLLLRARVKAPSNLCSIAADAHAQGSSPVRPLRGIYSPHVKHSAVVPVSQ